MTDWGFVLFLACGVVAFILLLILALCAAAGSADRRLERMREGARVYDFPERRR